MVCFAESLEVDDLSGAKESDDIAYIRVIAQAQNVVIGDTGFLLRGQILGQVGDRIAGDLHSSGGPGGAGGKLGKDAGGVVHKVAVKACGFDLLLAEVSGQLMDNGPNHFQVPKLLGPDVR